MVDPGRRLRRFQDGPGRLRPREVYDPRKPRQPGLLHIGYVLGGTGAEDMVAYTTSRPWPATVPLPAGARLFDREEAAELNQSRPFMLRLDVLEKLPMTQAWFPDIAQPGLGVIVMAPARLRDELTDLAINLVRRRRVEAAAP